MKKLSLTGIIKNVTLNQDIGHINYSFINFILQLKNDEAIIITVLPTLDEIPDFMIPLWIKNREEKEIMLNINERFGHYYCYESQFFWSIKNII